MAGKWLVMWGMLCCMAISSLAQEEVPKLPTLKLLQAIDKQYQKANERLQKQTKTYLNKLQKQEEKLKKTLAKTDSAKAEQVFGNIEEKY